jgi:hypothetical protein
MSAPYEDPRKSLDGNRVLLGAFAAAAVLTLATNREAIWNRFFPSPAHVAAPATKTGGLDTHTRPDIRFAVPKSAARPA